MTVIGTAYFTPNTNTDQLNKDFTSMINSMLKGQVRRVAERSRTRLRGVSVAQTPIAVRASVLREQYDFCQATST